MIAQEKLQRTFEQMCLDKLKEIGISSSAQRSSAMGYDSRNGLSRVIMRIKKNMPERLKVYSNKRPRLYEAV